MPVVFDVASGVEPDPSVEADAVARTWAVAGSAFEVSPLSPVMPKVSLPVIPSELAESPSALNRVLCE